MFKMLKQLISPLVEIVIAPLIAVWIQNNLARARAIKIVAEAIAAQLLVEFPTAEWAVLLDLAVRRLGEQLPPGIRTSNAVVLRDAAVAALKAAGKAPAIAPIPR